MSSKRRLMITVDDDVYVYFRLYREINLSSHVNEMLKFQMHANKDNREDEELENKLSSIQKSRKELDQEAAKIQSELLNRRTQRDQTMKQQLQEAADRDDTIRAAGVAADFFD